MYFFCRQVSELTHQYEFKIRGPAGLFKNRKVHKFCWSVLERCNRDPTTCPIDEITFHRKGKTGDAHEIVEGAVDLIDEIYMEFPKLKNFVYSNSEADPIAGWSTPRDFHEDVRYASITVVNILLHLKEKYNGRLPRLESISHDNSFLSYHPYEFSQRTLLTRFQMNETTPRHVQFIQKPVYAALGMMANLGGYLDEIVENNGSNVIHMSTKSVGFVATIITTLDTTNSQSVVSLDLNVRSNASTYTVFVEVLEQNRTDPAAIWRRHGKPPYPNPMIRRKMRENQYPAIYLLKTINRTSFDNEKQSLNIHIPLNSTFVVLIRICTPEVMVATPPINLRYRFIFKKTELMIFWSSDSEQCCIKSYQIYFKSIEFESRQRWKCLTCRQHLPFLSYQHAVGRRRGATVLGSYRVRAIDILGRKSKFSKILTIKQ